MSSEGKKSIKSLDKIQTIILEAFVKFNRYYKVGDSLGVIRPLQHYLIKHYELYDSEQYLESLNSLIELEIFETSGSQDFPNIVLTKTGYEFLSARGH